MEDEIQLDMSAAVDALGAELGFGESSNKGDVLDLLPDGTVTPNTSAEKPEVPAEVPEKTANPEAPITPTSDEPAPPKTWRKEAAAAWAAIPAEARAEILKREDDMFRGIEAYKADAGFGKSLKTAMEPYLPILEQYQIDPAVQVKQLMQAHHTLALGSPEQKLALFQRLASDYQIDLTQLGIAGIEAPYVDPAVKSLQTELQAVKSQLSSAEQARLAEARTALEKQISTFAQDPANAHFNDVANDMVKLLEKGVCKTLPEAYERAVWMNPAVRAKEIARQQAEAVQKAQTEAAQKAESARKAMAANVRTSAKGGSAAAPLGSIDDTLAETYAAIKSRG